VVPSLYRWVVLGINHGIDDPLSSHLRRSQTPPPAPLPPFFRGGGGGRGDKNLETVNFHPRQKVCLIQCCFFAKMYIPVIVFFLTYFISKMLSKFQLYGMFFRKFDETS
jgi:hypothetical protein